MVVLLSLSDLNLAWMARVMRNEEMRNIGMPAHEDDGVPRIDLSSSL